MDGWKRWVLALVAALMAVFFTLSATDLLVREEKQEIKRISVFISGENSSVWEHFRRGIQEAANEDRVEINYVTLEEEGSLTQMELVDREYERGAQAMILSLNEGDGMEQFLEEKEDMVPVITVNSQGSFPCQAGSVLYDTDQAAQLLADMVLKEQAEDRPILLVDGKSQISKRAKESLRKAFTDRKANLVPEKIKEETGILVGCDPIITEKLLTEEWAKKGWDIYGMGYSETILRAMEEGSVRGVIAYSMYAMGVHALREAIKAIEHENTKEPVYVEYRWITGKNLRDEQSYLFPIH